MPGRERFASATVLYAEMREYGLWTQALSSREISKIVQLLYSSVGDTVYLFGAHYMQFVSDGMLCVFSDIGAPRAREKGLELLVDLGDELPGWVRGDVTRLRQVLLNLVNNAVKFTDPGQVLVSAHLLEDFRLGQGALVEFRIKDSGIGIAPDRQAALFESFVQVDASTTRKYGGTGLGLAICKRLVSLMGGRVGLKLVPGEGSEFWFTARLGHADAPEVAMRSALHVVSLAGKRAVVVDDTPLNLRILDKQLRRWGMEPVLFERAGEAIAWLDDHPVDVVASDTHTPHRDGLNFVRLPAQAHARCADRAADIGQHAHWRAGPGVRCTIAQALPPVTAVRSDCAPSLPSHRFKPRQTSNRPLSATSSFWWPTTTPSTSKSRWPCWPSWATRRLRLSTAAKRSTGLRRHCAPAWARCRAVTQQS